VVYKGSWKGSLAAINVCSHSDLIAEYAQCVGVLLRVCLGGGQRGRAGWALESGFSSLQAFLMG
jgi:hypothetical protein